MMDNLLPPRMLEKLNLTADQKTKYDSLNASYKKDLSKLRSSHSSSTESSGTSTNSTGTENHHAMRELHKKYMDQFRPSLTSEQTATLDKAAENMHSRHEGQSGGSSSNATPKPSAPPSDN